MKPQQKLFSSPNPPIKQDVKPTPWAIPTESERKFYAQKYQKHGEVNPDVDVSEPYH
jgi:hypothetical protein